MGCLLAVHLACGQDQGLFANTGSQRRPAARKQGLTFISAASGSRSATRRATAGGLRAGEQGVLSMSETSTSGSSPAGPQDRQPSAGGGGEHELHDGRR